MSKPYTPKKGDKVRLVCIDGNPYYHNLMAIVIDPLDLNFRTKVEVKLSDGTKHLINVGCTPHYNYWRLELCALSKGVHTCMWL